MKHTPILMVAVLLLAASLRITNLDAQSFWNDEGNSARIAERSPRLIVEGAGGDIHPPGYYLMLAGWRTAAGYSEFSLRLFSAFASLGAVAVVYALGRKLFSEGAGVLGALLAALNPFQVYYAQEARMYALLALLTAASLLLTVGVLRLPAERGPRTVPLLVGYVLVNALGLYTHYSFPFVIAAETLAFLVWLAPRGKRLHGLAVWGVLQGATLLLYLPWVRIAIRQVSGWPTGGVGGVPLADFLQAWAFGTTLTTDEAALGLIPLLIMALLGLFPDRRTGYLAFTERAAILGLGAVVLPAGLLALGANSEPFLKFLLPANLALMLLAGQGLVMAWRLSRGYPLLRGVSAGVAVLLAAPLVMGLRNIHNDATYARADYRAIAQTIRAQAGEDAAVVLTAPNQWEVFTYYYPDGPGIAPLPDGQTQTTLERLLADYNRIYAVFWGEGQQDPEREVEATLDARAFPVAEQWVSDVRFVTYAVPAEPATEPQTPVEIPFGADGIVLSGYSLSTGTARPGDALGVTLFWQTASPIGERYKVFVHMVGPDGLLLTQHDSEPGSDLRPTTTWEPGEVIIDNHGLLIPLEAQPGTYRILIGMYTGETRLTTSSGGDAFEIGSVVVEP